jgi:transcriptional regulator with XRE-family HTH domain
LDEQKFGQRLKQLREAAGYSQEELAKAADLSSALVRHLEQGLRRNPTMTTLQRLARALNITAADLIVEADPDPDPDPEPAAVEVPR